MTTLVYVHGQNSSAWYGKKITYLRPLILKSGVNAVARQYDVKDDIQTMENQLIEQCLDVSQVPGNLILLGSSQGGYLSVKASQKIQTVFQNRRKEEGNHQKLLGIFLMAPAIGIKPNDYIDPHPVPAAVPISIVHGFYDAVIPYKNSVDFAQKYGAILTLFQGDHGLNKQHEKIGNLLEGFIRQVQQ